MILKDLYNSEEFSDVKFTVGEQQFHAHKVVVCRQWSELSKVLSQKSKMTKIYEEIFNESQLQEKVKGKFWFSVAFGDQIDVVELWNITAETFEIFLKYLYSGEWEDPPDHLKSSLVTIAEKIGCTPFLEKLNCIEFSKVSTENVISVLLFTKDERQLCLGKTMLQHYTENVLWISALRRQAANIVENLELFFSIIKNQDVLSVTEDYLLVMLLSFANDISKNKTPEFIKNLFGNLEKAVRWKLISMKVLQDFIVSNIVSEEILERFMTLHLKTHKNMNDSEASGNIRAMYLSIETQISKISHSLEELKLEDGKFTANFPCGQQKWVLSLNFKIPLRLCKFETDSLNWDKATLKWAIDSEYTSVVALDRSAIWPGCFNSTQWMLVFQWQEGFEEGQKISFSLLTKTFYPRSELEMEVKITK